MCSAVHCNLKFLRYHVFPLTTRLVNSTSKLTESTAIFFGCETVGSVYFGALISFLFSFYLTGQGKTSYRTECSNCW